MKNSLNWNSIGLLLISAITFFASITSANQAIARDKIPFKDSRFPNANYPYYDKVNGCGGTDWSRHVPDMFGFFTPACDEHDRCYMRLGSDRGKCDRALRANLEKICENEPLVITNCYGTASAYAAGVRKFGKDIYLDSQKKAKEYIDFVTTSINDDFSSLLGRSFNENESKYVLSYLVNHSWPQTLEHIKIKHEKEIIKYLYFLNTGEKQNNLNTQAYRFALLNEGKDGVLKEIINISGKSIINSTFEKYNSRSPNVVEDLYYLSLAYQKNSIKYVKDKIILHSEAKTSPLPKECLEYVDPRDTLKLMNLIKKCVSE